MEKTLASLVTETQKLLYQVSGPAVQLYSEDNLGQKLQHAFEFLFKHRFWSRHLTWLQYTLDGTTGRATATVNLTFAEFADIAAVYPGTSHTELSRLPSRINPFNMTGTTPQHVLGDATNVFRVAPFTATGLASVVGRTGTKTFVTSDNVPFDYLALVYNAAWQWATDDATNPAMAQKFQLMFETRLKQLEGQEDSGPIELLPRGYVPDQWW